MWPTPTNHFLNRHLLVNNRLFRQWFLRKFNTLVTFNSSIDFTHLFCGPVFSETIQMVKLSHFFEIESFPISLHRDFMFTQIFWVPQLDAHSGYWPCCFPLVTLVDKVFLFITEFPFLIYLGVQNLFRYTCLWRVQFCMMETYSVFFFNNFQKFITPNLWDSGAIQLNTTTQCVNAIVGYSWKHL